MKPTLFLKNQQKSAFMGLRLVISLSLAWAACAAPHRLLGQDSTAGVTLESTFQLREGTQAGVLTVTATVVPGSHIYSITQKPGGPLKSKLSVSEAVLKELGEFIPLQGPHVIKNHESFGIDVEQHEGVVVWQAPIKLASDASPSQIRPGVRLRGLVCSDITHKCIPFDTKVKASFQGFVAELAMPAAPADGTSAEKVADAKPPGNPKKLVLDQFQPQEMHVTLSGSIYTADAKQNFKPGDTVTLDVTAVPLEDFHFYRYATPKDGLTNDYTQTLVSFKRPEGWKITGPTESQRPHLKDGLPLYHGTTTWSFKVEIPADALADQAVAITGGVQIGTCNDGGCDRPIDSQFTVTIPLGTDSAAALKFSPAKSQSVVKAVKQGNFADPTRSYAVIEDGDPSETSSQQDELVPIQEHGTASDREYTHDVKPDSAEQIAAMARLYDVEEKVKYLNYSEMDANPVGSGGTSSASQTSFGVALLFAFLGGALLNLMPCVFPVLGIKVMGFVKQGGEKASKVRMHGFAFAAGLVVSMWILAGGLLVLQYGFGQNIIWGEQMANPYFVGGIIVLLFLLGLNMAGVFEVGTSLTSVGGNVANKEGYSGSFFSGVLTTLIATPCSGPFLGAAMTYALSQTPLISMVMFTVFGLGIATPYVLLSMFPPLIKALPKPGPWMETFKVTMAFALFATVAWFMQTFGEQTGIDGMSYMLMGLVIVGLSAYFYGTWGEAHIAAGKRWVFGYAMPMLIAAGGFWAVYSGASQFVIAEGAQSEVSQGSVPWVTWNPGKVKQELASNRIVWADYTANW